MELIEIKKDGNWKKEEILNHFTHPELPDIPISIHVEISDNDPNDGKKRIAVYHRSNHPEEFEWDLQWKLLGVFEEEAKLNPGNKLVGIYSDQGINGHRIDNRKALLKLIEDCKAGKIDKVVTRSMSYLSRKQADIEELLRQMKELGVGVRCLMDDFDSTEIKEEVNF